MFHRERGEGCVSFDIVRPLRYVEADAYRKPWEEFFASYQGPDWLRVSRPEHHYGR